MKTIVVLTLGALLFCSGCEQEAEKHAVQPETRPQFSVDLATAHVDIMNCDHNVLENGRSVRMNLRVTYSDSVARNLGLIASRDRESRLPRLRRCCRHQMDRSTGLSNC